MNSIRWGIIGCGDVTERKSGPAFQKVESSQLAMVMRRDAAACEDYARRHGVAHFTTNADELIYSPEVDAVYVATPPSTHAQYALRVMKAGKPVYIEKPLGATVAQCEQIVAAQKETGMPAFCAYYRRRLPYFLKIEALLKEGAIGTPRTVTVAYCQKAPEQKPKDTPWRFQKDISGGGLLLDVGSHTLDILDYLLGPVHSVKAFNRNQLNHYDVEDVVSAAATFESGMMGSFLFTFQSAFSKDENVIEGTEGRILFSTFQGTPICLEKKDGTVETFHIPMPYHIQQPMIAHITNCLLGKEKPVSTAETAIRTSKIMEEMVRG